VSSLLPHARPLRSEGGLGEPGPAGQGLRRGGGPVGHHEAVPAASLHPDRPHREGHRALGRQGAAAYEDMGVMEFATRTPPPSSRTTTAVARSSPQAVSSGSSSAGVLGQARSKRRKWAGSRATISSACSSLTAAGRRPRQARCRSSPTRPVTSAGHACRPAARRASPARRLEPRHVEVHVLVESSLRRPGRRASDET